MSHTSVWARCMFYSINVVRTAVQHSEGDCHRRIWTTLLERDLVRMTVRDVCVCVSVWVCVVSINTVYLQFLSYYTPDTWDTSQPITKCIYFYYMHGTVYYNVHTYWKCALQIGIYDIRFALTSLTPRACTHTHTHIHTHTLTHSHTCAQWKEWDDGNGERSRGKAAVQRRANDSSSFNNSRHSR